jgi:putative ATP-dependent endonuclease of OLD family
VNLRLTPCGYKAFRDLHGRLFNQECITEFLAGPRDLADLPEMFIEVFINGLADPDFDGRNNSKGKDAVGIKLICGPVDQYSAHIKSILKDEHENFPFEYYAIHFQTFTDELVSLHKKPLKHVLVDSAQINNDYATNAYTKSMYAAHASIIERNLHGFEYRRAKSKFRDEILKSLNDKLDTYKFDVRTSPKASLETDIIITEDEIPIERKGKGRQCFIKTEFALLDREHTLDVLLLEEPENHLSPVHMKKLIERIRASKKKQLFIATHSSFIATRLNLKKILILSEEKPTKPATLKDLSKETSEFFMKAPDNNVLELVLCKKAMLVEGDAEFILIDALYKNAAPGSSTDSDGVHVISVDGTSFKRYLELASLLQIRIAAIRDNDRDHQAICIDSYKEHISKSIQIFADEDNNRYTFEICIYQDNKKLCDDEFTAGRIKLTVQEFMLKNKTDVAFTLLEKHGVKLIPPAYIKKAVEWIRE